MKERNMDLRRDNNIDLVETLGLNVSHFHLKVNKNEHGCGTSLRPLSSIPTKLSTPEQYVFFIVTKVV